MAVKINLAGQRFGKLTVIEFLCRLNLHSMFKCVCDCGNETIVTSNNLRRGHTTSCGCASSRHRLGDKTSTHRLRNHPLYSIWTSMRNRCYWDKHHRSKNYKLRGIIVCEEWKNDFVSFYNWSIENGWVKGLSIDRINNDGNYCPSNCRWATVKEQSRNRTSNVWLTINGDKKIAKDWSLIYGVQPATIHQRLKKGWSHEEAVFGKKKIRSKKYP